MKNDITLKDLESAIRNVPDFPMPGILFKDITTALKRPEIYAYILDTLYEQCKDKGITKVVGIESRGFIGGSVLAYRLGAGFVPVRKPGKLPAEAYSVSYTLEYGQGTLEMHKDALEPGDIVLLHDDLLATGGSAAAALELISKFDVKAVSVSFIIELLFLEGRNRIPAGTEIFSILAV